MPRARTATTATDRSRIGGICQALAMSQAETPASASALPRANTPNVTASARRGRRGRSSANPESSGSRDGMGLASDCDEVVADGADGVAVADHQHRGALVGDVADRLEDEPFALFVEMGRRFVEEKDRPSGAER